MDGMTVFNIIAGIASIVSLFIALSAKSDVKKIQKIQMNQHGSGNIQSGRDYYAR